MSEPRRWRFIAAGTIFAAVLLGGRFGWLWSVVRPPVYAATATLRRFNAATSSHNQYLNILAEQGLLGIAALAALLAALIAGLIRARSEISRLGIAMLATYAVAGLVLEPLNSLQTSGTLWLVLGAGLVPATSRQAVPAMAESAPQPARAAQPGIVEAIT